MQTTHSINGTSPASLIMSVVKIMKSRLEKELPLPFSQCEVLRVVSDMENPSMSDLAERFKIAAPSATALVEPLVREEYMIRMADEKDRRQVRLSLTAKGTALKSEIEKKRNVVIEGLLSGLDASDVEHLKRILTSIITHAS